jgi:cytochrome P450
MRNPALQGWGDYDRDDPYPLFAQVQADGPVHEVTLADGHRAWLIVRHEEAKAALNHAGLSKDMHAALARDGAVVAEGLPGPAFARHMLSVDPPDHTRLRRLTSAAFSRPRIAALRPRVQAIADRLLDDLAARGDTVVDLVKGFAFPLPFTVISELLGVPEPDRDRLGSWFTTLLAPSSAPEPPAEAVAASGDIVRYLTELLASKRAAPGEDLVTDLVRAADQDGALSEQEMLSTIFQLVVAGHDTTTSLIGNATVALLLHPGQRDALVADPALVPHAVEEILRWDAPVPHSTFRYTTQDIALGGTVIPAFAQVIISLAAANRDPARYANPEDLDITRADTSHLAFGHGVHHCLGARLARLEGVIALTTLHGRFPAMRLAVPRSALRWGHGDGLVLRGLSELPVILGAGDGGAHRGRGGAAGRGRAAAGRGRVCGITTRRLAEEAGLNHCLVHNYFGSNENLLVHALARFTGRLITRQRELYAADLPFAGKGRIDTGHRDLLDWIDQWISR